MKHYDYIIAGGGCAGLSLAFYMAKCGLLDHKKVLLIDREKKTKNDRTWCFWSKEKTEFEPIIYRSWDHLRFYSNHGSCKQLSLKPYQYHMIRGLDFYEYVYQLINTYPIDFHYDDIISIEKNLVKTTKRSFSSDLIFNSAIQAKTASKAPPLLQHFLGWYVSTKEAVFHPHSAHFMDFRTPQEDLRFFYLLPVSKHEALIEYTLFSPQLLNKPDYENALRNYTNNVLKINDYQIQEEEYGVIPMDHRSPYKNTSHIIHIGTVGGHVKASSGYAFMNIQKAMRQITDQLIINQPVKIKTNKKRFLYYDAALLHILKNKSYPGYRIFEKLIMKNRIQTIFGFLDEETSFIEELKIMSSTPQWPFIKALLKNIFS